MTVQDLIDSLSGYELDAEVRIAYQPNYPLECGVAGAIANHEIDVPEEEATPSQPDEGQEVVWITAGNDIGYASARLWRL
jgi:hypothetical protein